MATVNSLVCWGGSAGKTATFTVTGSVVNITAHGLRTGMALFFTTTGSLPTGLSVNTLYYARQGADADKFTLHTSKANAVANTGQVTFTTTGTGTHTGKSNKIFPGVDTSRWGSRIYAGLNAACTARSSATTGYDQEVIEIGDGFYDPISGTIIVTGSPNTLITSKVNGARSDAYHQGLIDQYGWVGTCPGADITLGAVTNIEGLSIRPTSATGMYVSNVNASVRNCVFFSSGTRTGTGAVLNGQKCYIENNIFYNLDQGLVDYNSDQSIAANNIAVKCNYGIRSNFDATTNRFGFWYNNIAIGCITANWGVKPTTLNGATNNFGVSGDTNPPWAIGAGTTGTVATTDFANYAGNDFRPASASSPQVEAGLAYYGVPTSDILDAVRPNYMNGAAAYFDVGPFEFDHGYGLAPETLLSISNLLSGSTVRIFTTGTQTVQASTTSSSTSYAPLGLSGTVDVTIFKDGYVPIRLTGIALASGSTQSVDGSQTLDRAYVASSGLTYGTTATVDTSTNRFTLTTGTTGQNWYSFWIEQYRSNSALYNKPFPLQANGPNSFTLRLGYEFSSGLSYITRDGIRYTDTSGVVTATYAALLSVGVPSGLQVRYEQTDGGALSDASNTGNIDQLVQVYGDASHGNFDRTGFLVCKVQAEGYDQIEVDVVAQYGTLEDQLYVIALTPAANGVAAANQTVSSVTITDHGASPVTWNTKAFSITITDSGTTTGQQIMQWIRHALAAGGTFQGKNGFNWHDLVQANGDKFKGVRGALYGDTGAALKGVRVLRGTDAHPDFTIHTADDGTTVSTTPPAQATANILANSRIQLYNVTTATELDNAFITGTAYANTLTSGVSVGDTLRLRVCKLGYDEAESSAIWTVNGCSFIVAQNANAVYAAWGIDGSTVTEYSADTTGHVYIDANDVDGMSQKVRLGAWYSYILTTSIGIQKYYGAVSYLSAAQIRVNVGVVDLLLKNINSTTALKFTDLDVRLYRSDGSSIISPDSYSIHNDYSGVPDVVNVGGSALTSAESAKLMSLPDASTNATATWGYGSRTLTSGGGGGGGITAADVWNYATRTITNTIPTASDNAAATVTALNSAMIPVDVQSMNGAEVIGDGTQNNPWRGLGVPV